MNKVSLLCLYLKLQLHIQTVRISTSNRMFGRTIWDKLPECIFENFEIGRVKRE